MTTSDSAKPFGDVAALDVRRLRARSTALVGVSPFAIATAECASASLVSASVPASATGGAPGCIDLSGSTDAGQHLVLHLDEVERLLGDGELVGGHRGHGLAGEHDAVDGEHRVRARRRLPLQLGDVGGGEHRAHAGQRARLARVDLHDAGVRVRAAQELRVQQAARA